MTQVEKRWPESTYFLLSREDCSKRVVLKPCVSLMGEIPSHLTAETVSCKQLLPASRLVPHASVKVESSYFRASVSLLVAY